MILNKKSTQAKQSDFKMKTIKIIIDDVEVKIIKVKYSKVDRLLEIIDLYNQA
jgi:hypothetical protein